MVNGNRMNPANQVPIAGLVSPGAAWRAIHRLTAAA